MSDAPKSHLYTERGTLCGAASRPRWQTVESAVDCQACRAMIGIDRLQLDPPARVASPRAPAKVRMVLTVGVLRGPGSKKVLLS